MEITFIKVFYWATSFVLALALYKPAKKLIYVQKVRKAERKLKRETTEDERKEIERRSIPVTVFIVLAFAFLFNKVLMSKYFLPK